MPSALLGMPHLPSAWAVDTWKPIGGCSFTGSPTALTGSSAFRFCLLMQWRPRAIDPQHTPLGRGSPPDPNLEPVDAARETNSKLLVRQLLHAATDQSSQECGSPAASRLSPICSDPQKIAPYMFVPWSKVAYQVNIPGVQAAPLPNLCNGVLHAIGLLPESQQKEFHAAFAEVITSIPTSPEPLETLALLILKVVTSCTDTTRHGLRSSNIWRTTMEVHRSAVRSRCSMYSPSRA